MDTFVLSTERTPRRHVAPSVISAHHRDLPTDQCWRCWRLTASPERAHLIDRCYGGLDGAQNLALLCGPCHRAMPSFKPGEENAAKTYVFWGADVILLPNGVEPTPDNPWRIDRPGAER